MPFNLRYILPQLSHISKISVDTFGERLPCAKVGDIRVVPMVKKLQMGWKQISISTLNAAESVQTKQSMLVI